MVPVYEHPWFVRLCHWTNAIALGVLVASGLMIFSAFPQLRAEDPAARVVFRDWVDGQGAGFVAGPVVITGTSRPYSDRDNVGGVYRS